MSTWKNSSDDIKYIMFHIDRNLGSDMNGIYFIQYTGNEKAINKFKKINTNGNVKFYNKEYTFKQIECLLVFENLWNLDQNDNVERYILSGNFNVPGKNKVYSEEELYDWWIKYLGDPKNPFWINIINIVIDLVN